MAAKLDGLSEQVEENLTEYQALQEETQEDKAAVEDLLALGKAAQQVHLRPFTIHSSAFRKRSV